MQSGIEQRKHRRYQLNLPVSMRSKSSRATPVTASSRDISAQGIYFTISKEFDLGSKLEFDLDLPPALAQGKQVRIHCTAKIIRVDRLKDQDQVGVAAQIENYKFVRSE